MVNGRSKRDDLYSAGPEPPVYISLNARPPRLGIFLPLATNMPWERTYEMVLAAQSHLWGGSGSLVFPATDDIADNELFWSLAERFDADYFMNASFTMRDLSEVNPEWFTARQANSLRTMDRDIPTASSEERARLLEGEMDQVAFEWSAPESFVELVDRRLAPFHHEGPLPHYFHPFAIEEHRRLSAMGGEMLADLTQIVGWPAQVVNPLTELGSLERLLLTAGVGRMNAGLVADLAKLPVQVGTFDVEDHKLWAELVLEGAPQSEFPWRITEQGLSWYRLGPLQRRSVVVVAGETPWDFTLWYALRRWGLGAFWLPGGLSAETGYADALASKLFGLASYAEDGAVKVVSWSDTQFRDEIAEQLREGAWRISTLPADWQQVLPDRPLRLLERDAPGRPEPIAVHHGATVELPTPIPASAEIDRPTSLRWVIDAYVDGWAPVRHGALGQKVLDQPGFDSDRARTGRNGVAYTSTRSLTFTGETLAMTTVRPRIRPRPLLAQLDAALEVDGWSCQGSDKGAYAGESAALFGGFRELARGLLDPDVRAALEAFRDPNAPGKQSGDRRFLTYADVVEVIADRTAAESVVERLTSTGVLTLGLFLKCTRCRRATWYDLSEITAAFRCRRCRYEQLLSRDRWLGTVEPEWHYELAEVVTSFLGHHGELPVLAVHQLFPEPARPSEDIEVAFEIEIFSPDGMQSETDIAVREGSKLWLGEATIKDHLEQAGSKEAGRLSRLSDVAGHLAAVGVIVASSTQFRSSTRSRIGSIFDGYWPTLRLQEDVTTKP